jgi:hypothetical protein
VTAAPAEPPDAAPDADGDGDGVVRSVGHDDEPESETAGAGAPS